jgi:hypothetical protein
MVCIPSFVCLYFASANMASVSGFLQNFNPLAWGQRSSSSFIEQAFFLTLATFFMLPFTSFFMQLNEV